MTAAVCLAAPVPLAPWLIADATRIGPIVVLPAFASLVLAAAGTTCAALAYADGRSSRAAGLPARNRHPAVRRPINLVKGALLATGWGVSLLTVLMGVLYESV